jgi:hypothetical protein
MRAKAKRKERDELLEEEREDLLDLYVTPAESYAHRRACIDLIAEADACLDGDYNAHDP